MLPTIEWRDGKVVMIDQRKLPLHEVYLEFQDVNGVAEAIETMIIRGAPAIGVAAAYGVALGLQSLRTGDDPEKRLDQVINRLAKTRPTARNLFWALERMKRVFDEVKHLAGVEIGRRLLLEAQAIEAEDLETNRKIGANGRDLIRDGDSVLTHCNAGGLATAGYGTALGVIRAAFEQGKKFRVFVDETRPFLQGARLTAWELDRLGVPLILITDNMAGFLMKKGEVDLVIVGADRIAANGDAANKIGTYGLAVLARAHRIPFYVAAQLSTIDPALPDGDAIPIEERTPDEVTHVCGTRMAPEGIAVWNPAFDVTPHELITAIITEAGMIRPPFAEGIGRTCSAPSPSDLLA